MYCSNNKKIKEEKDDMEIPKDSRNENEKIENKIDEESEKIFLSNIEEIEINGKEAFILTSVAFLDYQTHSEELMLRELDPHFFYSIEMESNKQMKQESFKLELLKREWRKNEILERKAYNNAQQEFKNIFLQSFKRRCFPLPPLHTSSQRFQILNNYLDKFRPSSEYELGWSFSLNFASLN